MKVIQNIIHDEKETSFLKSRICGRDLLIVTQAFENFDQEKV